MLVIVALASCWSNLQLEDYFLSTDRNFEQLRAEVAGKRTAPSLHHFIWVPPMITTWEVLGSSPGLGLSPELIVESYQCTTKDTWKDNFEAIKKLAIRKEDKVIVVLQKGACPPERPSGMG